MSKKETRTKIVPCRFKASELEKIDAQAKVVNLSRSVYIRRKLQGLPIIPAKVSAKNWQLYKQLIELSHSLSLLSENISRTAKGLNSATEQKHLILSLLPPENLREAIVLIENNQQLIQKFCLELSEVK